MPADERMFWRSDTPPQAGGAPSRIWVGYDDAGAIRFSGEDSAAFGEPGHKYEHDVTVPEHGIEHRLAVW